MEELIKYAKETIQKHPQLKEDIEELMDLCHSEIEQGSSIEQEIELCMEDIRIMVEELNEKNPE